MKTPGTGRNDPCPCGSGKKFKHCCMGKENSTASGHGAGVMSELLRKALEGRQFNSLEEAQTFLHQHTQQQNRRQLDEFYGLSPEQMHQMLNFPFASPGLVRFPEVLDATPAAPILTLFQQLTDAIGEQGLKPTARGNLPRNFCREAALAYWGEQRYQEKTRYGGINCEKDFDDLHVTRLVAELAGLIRKIQGPVHPQSRLPPAAGRERPSGGLSQTVQGLCRTVQLGVQGRLSRTAIHTERLPVHALPAHALR